MSIKKTAAVGAAVVGIVAAGAGTALASSGAQGVAANSPGVVSGNQIQIPVHVPLNVCGNTVNVLIGVLNPAFGNTCINAG
ncbi:chaplin [Kitasatospora sp. NPDC097605]|uniref:chaplin n=1 Tax=Kitasatospora sp. NPDC097605 TaxID=3157226 RepID=UPI0033257E3B